VLNTGMVGRGTTNKTLLRAAKLELLVANSIR